MALKSIGIGWSWARRFDPHGPRAVTVRPLELCLGSASPDSIEAQHSQSSLQELLGWQHGDKKFADRASDDKHVQRESRNVFHDDPRSNKDRVITRPTDDDALAVNRGPQGSSVNLGDIPTFHVQNRKLPWAGLGRGVGTSVTSPLEGCSTVCSGEPRCVFHCVLVTDNLMMAVTTFSCGNAVATLDPQSVRMERMLQRKRCRGHRLHESVQSFDVLRVECHLSSDHQQCCTANISPFVPVSLEQDAAYIAPSGLAVQAASFHPSAHENQLHNHMAILRIHLIRVKP